MLPLWASSCTAGTLTHVSRLLMGCLPKGREFPGSNLDSFSSQSSVLKADQKFSVSCLEIIICHMTRQQPPRPPPGSNSSRWRARDTAFIGGAPPPLADCGTLEPGFGALVEAVELFGVIAQRV